MQKAAFGSASVAGGSFPDCVDRAADEALAALGNRAPDVAFLFVSPAYGPSIAEAGQRLHERFGARHVLGCTGGGVLAKDREIEDGPAVAVMAGVLPGARLTTFHLRHEGLLALSGSDALRGDLGVAAGESPVMVLLADPFSVDSELLLGRMEQAFPGVRAVGGLASGGARPGTHALFADDRMHRSGAVGLSIDGFPVRTVVSQGCRPVGRRFVITRCDENKLLGLSGRPALVAIQEVVAALDADDRELARTSLLLGRVTHEAREDFGRGDFLIRNFLGVVPDEQAVVVADRLRVGQTVQLQLRDKETATEDLDVALTQALEDGEPVRAALVFSCAGRGRRLFGAPDHDVSAVGRATGGVPLAGFFCNGEMGAIGGRNFLHGFTASIALF